MTKLEFIQQVSIISASKLALSRDFDEDFDEDLTDNIFDTITLIADEFEAQSRRVYIPLFEKEQPKKRPYSDLESVSVNELSLKDKRMRTRFLRVCHNSNIESIAQLLHFGSGQFSRIRNIGRRIIKDIDEALSVQYGIDKW